MVQDNRGFAAVVAAVERLRDTTGSIGQRQLGVGRQRYQVGVEQTEILGKILSEVTGITAILGKQPQGQKAIRFTYDGEKRNVTGYRVEENGIVRGYEANSGKVQSFSPEKMEDRQDYLLARSERQKRINEAIARENRLFAKVAGESTTDGFKQGLESDSPG